MKRYAEVNDPEAKSTKQGSNQTTSNTNWLSDAQSIMESVEGMEVKALIGKLYGQSKKCASKLMARKVFVPLGNVLYSLIDTCL